MYCHGSAGRFLHKGFGIPLLEAMNCNIPIISSNTTSLPEVCGEASIYVDPNSVDSIKNGLLNISENKKLRSELVEKGRLQREKFSWENTSDKLWKSMLMCID